MEKKIILPAESIRKRVRELGEEISRDYAGRRLLMVGVLNGAFIFLADLVRELSIPCEIDFVRVASYGAGTSAGEIRFVKDIELPVEGRDVLLVEDIIDTGKTLAFLRDTFADRRADSVRICAFIDKKERRLVEVEAAYSGFHVAEGFLVGYGLDHAEQHRHLPDVCHLSLGEG